MASTRLRSVCRIVCFGRLTCWLVPPATLSHTNTRTTDEARLSTKSNACSAEVGRRKAPLVQPNLPSFVVAGPQANCPHLLTGPPKRQCRRKLLLAAHQRVLSGCSLCALAPATLERWIQFKKHFCFQWAHCCMAKLAGSILSQSKLLKESVYARWRQRGLELDRKDGNLL